MNHEFMARGGDRRGPFVVCPNGDYLADSKAATPKPPDAVEPTDLEPLRRSRTPGAATIDGGHRATRRAADRTLKCILFRAGDTVVAVARARATARSTRRSSSGGSSPRPSVPFEDADFASSGYAKGFVGPQGFSPEVVVLADEARSGAAAIGSPARTRPIGTSPAPTSPRDFRVDEYQDLVHCARVTAVRTTGRHFGSNARSSSVTSTSWARGTRSPWRRSSSTRTVERLYFRWAATGWASGGPWRPRSNSSTTSMGLPCRRSLAPFEVVVVIGQPRSTNGWSPRPSGSTASSWTRASTPCSTTGTRPPA